MTGHVLDAQRQRIGADLLPLLRAEVGSEGLAGIAAYDRTGQEIGRAVEPGFEALLPERAKDERARSNDVSAGAASAVRVVVPHEAGTVVALVTTDDDSTRVAPLLRLVGLYTAIVAVSLLGLAYYALTRLIVKPLDELARSAERVANGARKLVVPQTSVKELGELGGSLRTMTERLLSEEEALRRKVDEVEKATASLKEAQDRLVRSERLASVGRLAAGLAHEIGNPIAALIGLQDLLLEGGLDEAEQRDFLKRMRKESERIHGILRDLLAFARPGAPSSDRRGRPRRGVLGGVRRGGPGRAAKGAQRGGARAPRAPRPASGSDEPRTPGPGALESGLERGRRGGLRRKSSRRSGALGARCAGSAWKTTGRGWIRRFWGAFSSLSRPRRTSVKVPGSGSRCAAVWSRRPAAASPSISRTVQARASSSTCRGALRNRRIVRPMRLGIDFGTTRTVVAAAVDGRYPVVVFETARGFSDFIPGLAVRNGAQLELGWAATHGLTQHADGAVRSIKRAISSRYPDDPLAELDSTTTALDLVHHYLSALRRLLLESANLEISPDEPLEAMIAVPANASTRQRYLTVEAFSRAGFKVLGMVNEPTAAAIEYAYNNIAGLGRRSPKRYVVVYDLGGGTFDTSAVSLADRRFELIATEGIGELGGEDFDEAILELTLGGERLASGRLHAGRASAGARGVPRGEGDAALPRAGACSSI